MRTAAVFMYHRLGDGRDDPFRLAVTPEAFEAQLDVLRRTCLPSRLDELGRPSARPRVAITFDDGYADNLHIAAPIADRMGVPIVVYVTTGLLGDNRGFWWDRLAAICRRALFQVSDTTGVAVEIELDGRTISVRLDGPDAASRLRDALHIRLRRQRRQVIEDILDRVAEQLGVEPAGASDARPLSVPELIELSRKSHVEIGAHTVDHDLLPLLSPPEQERQIHECLATLTGLTGGQVRHFAYPFGGADAFGGNAVRVVKRLGFHTGVTTLPGRVHRLTPRHRLPRYMVDPAEDFSLVLDRAGITSERRDAPPAPSSVR